MLGPRSISSHYKFHSHTNQWWSDHTRAPLNDPYTIPAIVWDAWAVSMLINSLNWFTSTQKELLFVSIKLFFSLWGDRNCVIISCNHAVITAIWFRKKIFENKLYFHFFFAFILLIFIILVYDKVPNVSTKYYQNRTDKWRRSKFSQFLREIPPPSKITVDKNYYALYASTTFIQSNMRTRGRKFYQYLKSRFARSVKKISCCTVDDMPFIWPSRVLYLWVIWSLRAIVSYGID